jgi:hypothetical protein
MTHGDTWRAHYEHRLGGGGGSDYNRRRDLCRNTDE